MATASGFYTFFFTLLLYAGFFTLKMEEAASPKKLLHFKHLEKNNGELKLLL